jgi:L-proline amide hydrolase
MELWVQEANKLRDALPADVQKTLLEHEAAGTTTSKEYTTAMMVFYARHVCRVQPMPDEVLRSFAQIEADPTVYFTMNGPSEFHVIGSLKHWSIIGRLHKVEVPTLLISGKYDEATPATVQPYKDNIKGARWQIFENSSHMPHVEETELYMKSVGAFLDQND